MLSIAMKDIPNKRLPSIDIDTHIHIHTIVY